MVTYSGHRWLLTPKEVINKPPEWLLKTRTWRKFLWTQKTLARPWHVAGVHQPLWVRLSCLFTIPVSPIWLWECPLLPHISVSWGMNSFSHDFHSAGFLLILAFDPSFCNHHVSLVQNHEMPTRLVRGIPESHPQHWVRGFESIQPAPPKYFLVGLKPPHWKSPQECALKTRALTPENHG